MSDFQELIKIIDLRGVLVWDFQCFINRGDLDSGSHFDLCIMQNVLFDFSRREEKFVKYLRIPL